MISSFFASTTFAESSPEMPNWLKLIGTGGLTGLVVLCGSWFAYLIKKHIDVLEAEKTQITNENAFLKTALEKAESDRDNALSHVEEAMRLFERMRASEFDAKDAGKYQRILVELDRYHKIQPDLEAYKVAASWLKVSRDSWIKTSTDLAGKRHLKHINPISKKKFESDLSKCIDWAFNALVVGHTKIPLENFIKKASIKSITPYKTAIKSIIDSCKNEPGNLTARQHKFLEITLTKLEENMSSQLTY